MIKKIMQLLGIKHQNSLDKSIIRDLQSYATQHNDFDLDKVIEKLIKVEKLVSDSDLSLPKYHETLNTVSVVELVSYAHSYTAEELFQLFKQSQ